MVHIAVVEDGEEDQKLIHQFLDRYHEENGASFLVDDFLSASLFLSSGKKDFDIVFMDIEMPGINGFDASVRFREYDDKTVLIFITNLNQYAIKGYSVNAFDYINKPVNYYSFSTMLKRAIRKAGFERKSEVIINSNGNIIKADINDIRYIEVMNHKLIYHLDDSDIVSWQSLSSVKESFLKRGFAMASVSVMINLRRILSLCQDCVTLDDALKTKLYLSRSQRKDFALAFSGYVSGD